MSQSLEALTNITLLYFTSLLQQVFLFFFLFKCTGYHITTTILIHCIILYAIINYILLPTGFLDNDLLMNFMILIITWYFYIISFLLPNYLNITKSLLTESTLYASKQLEQGIAFYCVEFHLLTIACKWFETEMTYCCNSETKLFFNSCRTCHFILWKSLGLLSISSIYDFFSFKYKELMVV